MKIRLISINVKNYLDFSASGYYIKFYLGLSVVWFLMDENFQVHLPF